MSDLDLLLGATNLTESVDVFAKLKSALPTEMLFRQGGIEDLDGDSVTFEKVENNRQIAGVRHIDGPAHNNSLENSKVVRQGWITTKEKKTIKPSRLFHRRGRGNSSLLGDAKSNARDIIADELENLVSKCWRAREYFCARVLQDTAGVAYGPSAAAFPSGACELAGNLTIDGGLQNAAITSSWNTETTKIFSDASATSRQLPYFHNEMEKNGHNIGHVIFNRTLAAAILGNIEAQTFLVNLPGVTREMLEAALTAGATRQGQDGSVDGSVFNGLGGIARWHNFSHGYANSAGTFTRYYDDDKVVFLTEDLKNCLRMYQGDVFIPNQNLIGDAAAAADLFAVKKGLNAYAYREQDDVGSIVLVVTDTFYPGVRNEKGIYLGTAATA